MPLKINPVDRFIDKIILDENDCWRWNASDVDGYGKFWYEGSMRRAHRCSYEFFIGKIPEGLTLDHLCQTKDCVNPWHLEPVTAVENLRRSPNAWYNRRKTRCPQGHSYDEQNTYITPEGFRQCRICRRETRRRFDEKRRRNT